MQTGQTGCDDTVQCMCKVSISEFVLRVILEAPWALRDNVAASEVIGLALSIRLDSSLT